MTLVRNALARGQARQAGQADAIDNLRIAKIFLVFFSLNLMAAAFRYFFTYSQFSKKNCGGIA
jgi:hypothetical protein